MATEGRLKNNKGNSNPAAPGVSSHGGEKTKYPPLTPNPLGLSQKDHEVSVITFGKTTESVLNLFFTS